MSAPSDGKQPSASATSSHATSSSSRRRKIKAPKAVANATTNNEVKVPSQEPDQPHEDLKPPTTAPDSSASGANGGGGGKTARTAQSRKISKRNTRKEVPGAVAMNVSLGTSTVENESAAEGANEETRSSRNRFRKSVRDADRFESRQKRELPSVDPIGEFSTKHVLWSAPQIGPSTLVRFDYKGPEESYVLCWIDEAGKRHHSYPHSGKEWSHQESSNAGHAFAIFRKRDGKLLASYKIIAALAEGQVHVVSLPELKARAETVVVEARVIAELSTPPEFPSDREWTVSYSFSVPPLPHSTNPDFFETNTIYVWGDLSFDEFALSDAERNPIHSYKMNQIVPQVMCGECLCGSEADTYIPYWRTFHTWVAQAQHYYQTDQGEALGSRAVCGELFNVEPGERMRTTIHYNGSEVVIRIASEDHPEHFSQVVSNNPFPNDTSIFPGGWTEFFKKKERASSKTFRAYPCFNIEYKAQNADLDVLESLCPFKIHEAKFPGSVAHTPEEMARVWHIRGMNFVAQGSKKIVDFC